MDLHIRNLSSFPPELFQHGRLPAAPDALVCPATSSSASQDGPVAIITQNLSSVVQRLSLC